MQSEDSPTVPPAILIHPTGAFDKAAMAAEVERRLSVLRTTLSDSGWDQPTIDAQIERYREIFAFQVRNVAANQRWPYLQRYLKECATAEESAELDRLELAKQGCSISAGGNRDLDALMSQHRRISDEIFKRAVEAIEATAPISLPLAAE